MTVMDGGLNRVGYRAYFLGVNWNVDCPISITNGQKPGQTDKKGTSGPSGLWSYSP